MKAQQHEQVAIYTDVSAIPGHQRAWVWGVVALMILLCGLAAGWLLADLAVHARPESRAKTTPIVASESVTQQEAINEQLRQQITHVASVLAGDSCQPATVETPVPEAGKR